MNTLKGIQVLLLCLLFIGCTKEKSNRDVSNVFNFKSYISNTSSGEISKASTINITLAKEVLSWVPNEEVSKNILRISPNVNGATFALNSRTIEFRPTENLKGNTEYTVTIDLGRIFPNVPKELKQYTFKFKTKTQDFIVKTNEIQSYNSDWQYIEGVVNSADVLTIFEVEKLISAKQKGKKLNIKWDTELSSKTNLIFKIDSIQKFDNESKVIVGWDGRSLGIANKGSNAINIAGKNNFSILNVKVVQSPEQYLQINFSDPLKKQQNFKGLVSIANQQNLKYVVQGNLLKVYLQERLIGDVAVNIFEGIKNTAGYKLKEGVSLNRSFTQIKPGIRLISNGVILPNSTNLKFNFQAVNLAAVDVRIIKIFQDNVLQFLQDKNLGSTNRYGIREVGRRVAVKTVKLIQNDIENTGKWKSYAIDLSEMIQTDPGAIYRIELSAKQQYSLYNCANSNEGINIENTSVDDYFEEEYYADDSNNLSEDEQEEREEAFWNNRLYNYRYRPYYNWDDRENPCKKAYYDNDDRIVSTNILGTDLGVTIKKGSSDIYFVAVNNLIDTNPVSNATVKLFNYQQQEIANTKTNTEGIARIELKKDAYFGIVSKGKNTSYVKIADGNSLSMSKFNVSGMKLQKGLKGYIYGERGVWRPGDSIHLTFVLNDKANPVPINHPIKINVTDARGKLVYKSTSTSSLNGFTRFSVPTKDTDPTGNWYATVKVGGANFSKSLKVETVKPNRLKINIDFDQEVLTSSENINGNLKINWLHGAVGKNLDAEVKMKLSETNTSFKGFEKYVFKDPIRTFNSEEQLIFNSKVNENGIGKINKKITVENQAPGMLRATFLTKAIEKGGDFSIDVFSKKYAPYISFVGLQSPEPKAYGSYFTDENVQFEVATIDPNGSPIKRSELDVKVYKIEWRWWWNSSYDDLSSYIGSEYHKPVKSFKIKTNSNGKTIFNINIPDADGGRYLIRILDPISGHATGRTAYFYKNWWQRPSGSSAEAANMLIFNADQDSYNVGEVAKITFPSSSNGRALVSIENGSEILETNWVQTQKGETTIEIPITKKMAPNIFLNISLLQPHASTVNDLPIRLYGVIPIMVIDPNTKLEPVISMPKSLRPEEHFIVKVKEKSGKRMTYTLAVVDEGLLDLTRFKTPNAWDEFYKKEALGVKTWDVYDDVIGAYSGSIDQVFAIGGDENLEGNKSKKANRFKSVITYMGPFVLEAGLEKAHKIKIPNYIGSVRTMVIAGDNSNAAYGNAQETTPVKKPLMVLASLPRKLSPGEKVRLPVTVFAMDKKVKEVSISIKTDARVKVIGNNSQKITFSKPEEKMVYFDLEVLDKQGITTINILANGNGEKANSNVELDVVNPNPLSSKVLETVLNNKEVKTIDFTPFGVAGTNSAIVEFSTLPPMNISDRLNYLIRYPHGCVEQTTSSVFPQLYLADIFDLSNERQVKMTNNIEKAIEKIGNFQIPNGGLSYWSGQRTANDWGTSYAGHFMVEAEKKGFVLPFSFLSNWIKYQQKAAREWSPSYKYKTRDIAQAYRLYTLALAGHPDLASMNRLREYSNLSNNAKWRLAAAYALAGQKEAAKKVAATASVDFKENKGDFYTYGSSNRNKAMALETMVLIEDENERILAESLASVLSSKKWMSTQTTAYSLLAMSKMVINNGGKSVVLKYALNGKKYEIETSKALVQRSLELRDGTNTILIENGQENVIYTKVIASGKLPIGKEHIEKRNLGVTVEYKDLLGKSVNVSKLQQGTEFEAVVTISNLKNKEIYDVSLTEIFPSGWEIVNTRFTDFGDTVSTSDYTDIRDDKANFYFDLGANKSRTFQVRLNASYLGNYYLFGVQAEGMYDNDFFTRTKGRWVEVVQ